MKKARIVRLGFLLTALLLSALMAPKPAFAIIACPTMSCSEAEALCNGIGGTGVYQYVGTCYDPAYLPFEWYLYAYYNVTCNGSYFGTCTDF